MKVPGSVFASAADATYGYHLLNLIGSVQHNSNVFEHMVAFDLGMTARQRSLIAAADGVELRRVPAFAPHWSRAFTWKPWAWVHAGGEVVFWIDAGATVLRSLRPALAEIRERGYFLVSQGNRLRDLVPTSYAREYGISADALSQPYVAAGVIGFSPGSRFFDEVIVPTYEDCLRGRNLGFSPGDVTAKNVGLNRGPVDVVHDCTHFRWDQSILNIHVARAWPDAHVADLDEYGGWRSPRDHPNQVIWHHRRPANLRYLNRVRFTGLARVAGPVLGTYYRARWWLELRRRFARPATYVLKVRAQLARRAAG